MMTTLRRVLFLCTGNTARSQMAEGLVNHHLGGTWQAFSAGTRPGEAVHPLAVQVMEEVGISLSGQAPKRLTVYRHEPFDLVITVCDDAAKHCPLWLGDGRRVHVGFPDPAAATGTLEERLRAFRRVREGIRKRIFPLLETFSPLASPPSHPILLRPLEDE